MREFGSQLGYLRDPRLTAHATSPLPAWLWSVDATHVLWANPVAAAIFDAPTSVALAGSTIDPKGTAALQIARLAGSLPHGAAPRLERLRGFGARLGQALMCACSRVTLADRTPAILVVSTEPAGPSLTLAERARRLLEGCDDAIALFSTDGALLHATLAAKSVLGRAATLAEFGAAPFASAALAGGQVSGQVGGATMSIERIGADASTVLLAVFAAQAAAEPTPAEPPRTEAVAPPPAPPAAAEPSAAAPADVSPAPASETPPAPPPERRPQQPLRFVWQMDADGRFTLGSDEFADLIGPATAVTLDQPWATAAAALGLDPDGQVARALASHDTWSGITVSFPVEGSSDRLAVELSGLPVFDRDRTFRGYRGFGVCRDVARIAELMQTRPAPAPANLPPASQPPADNAPPAAEPPPSRDERPTLTVVPQVQNVVPFRSSTPEKPPTLTPVERKAFGELASRLTARLRNADNAQKSEPPKFEPSPFEPPAPPPAERVPPASSFGDDEDDERADTRIATGDQRPILDRLPVGVLIYRLDNLIYANRAFLDWTGYGQLEALRQAGGLDALFVEPGVESNGKNGMKSLAVTTPRGDKMPVEARLFSTMWDGESALVLMLANAAAEDRRRTAEAALQEAEAQAQELRSIIDVASDGVVILDPEGRVLSLNPSAEALLGAESAEFAGLPFAGLFVPESQRIALEGLTHAAAGKLLNDGQEVIVRARDGSTLPLFMTMGPITGTEKLCAVFRDISRWKRNEEDLLNAKHEAERASSAKSDFLAKISHEIRTPLNAIIGFSEVMMEERFGAIGNDRYRQYLKDIHTSGGHLVSLLNDLLDLSKIEAGKLELTFASVDINELIQQCVGLMQPQASRGRIIIRTSLSNGLQPVLVDARSVRQIVLNLLSNSIKFTGAGGQVIVSTGVNDGGDVVLRVRDTGVGMSEKDIAVALEPFRQLATSARWGSGGTGLGLPLTKALAEANRGTFSIKSAVNAGTLVEVSFPASRLAAE